MTIFQLIVITNAHGQPRKIYIANDDHTDYMWTGDEETYQKVFSEMLDYYIRLNDSTASLPYNQQSKWNCDGSYWVYNYKKIRSAEQFNKIICQVKEDKITVPFNSMIVLLDAAPTEATIRDMYYAGSLKRRYGLDLSLVLNMEDQVLPLGLSSLWAGSGARYSRKGVCACATKVTGLEKRKNNIYRYKGLDNQQVLMKWYNVNPFMITRRSEYRYNLGNYLEASNHPDAIIDCQALMQDPSYPYSIAAAFGKGGDHLKTLTGSFVKVDIEKSDSDYEIIVSNKIDYFKDFEKNYGAALPSETVSYGTTEWGNSFASLAEVPASVKRAIEKLRTAEALHYPETFHEEADAILHAKSITKRGNYADSICRLDWLALNHFTDMSDDGHGMTISNRDAYYMKTGNSTINKLDDTTAQIKVSAAGRIDMALGMINQDGGSYLKDFLALKPHTGRFNASAAMRFALQHQNPLTAGKVTGGSGYDGKHFSLFSIEDSSVVVWALKPAEKDIEKGIILRAWNLANINTPVKFYQIHS